MIGRSFFRLLTETLSGPIVNAALQNAQYFTLTDSVKLVLP